MSFVDVNWTRELSFLSHSFSKNHDLLEKEDRHLLQFVVGSTCRVVRAQKGAVKEKLALCHNLTLEKIHILKALEPYIGFII